MFKFNRVLMVFTAMFAAAVLIGCGDDELKSGNPVGGDELKGGNLLLADGEAWVSTTSNTGYIFQDDDMCLSIGQTEIYDGVTWTGQNGTITGPATFWVGYPQYGGSYTVNGANLTFNGRTYAFGVSGSTLTLDMSGLKITYTKRNIGPVEMGLP